MPPPSALVQVVTTGAATAWVLDRLAGPERTARVVHAGRDAVYVDDGGRCLALLSRTAVAVPCGVRTLLDELAPVEYAAPATVGGGRMVLGHTEVSVTRVVDASVPSITRVPPVEVHSDELPARAADLLASADPEAAGLLLGRGSGLTPFGDDVLCGWLATTRALGLGRVSKGCREAAVVSAPGPAWRRCESAACCAERRQRGPVGMRCRGCIGGFEGHALAPGPLADEVRRLAPVRTTLLSTTLLDCAARGDVLPEFRDLLRTGQGLHALLAVGHTSGLGLALGMSLAGRAP